MYYSATGDVVSFFIIIQNQGIGECNKESVYYGNWLINGTGADVFVGELWWISSSPVMALPS